MSLHCPFISSPFPEPYKTGLCQNSKRQTSTKLALTWGKQFQCINIYHAWHRLLMNLSIYHNYTTFSPAKFPDEHFWTVSICILTSEWNDTNCHVMWYTKGSKKMVCVQIILLIFASSMFPDMLMFDSMGNHSVGMLPKWDWGVWINTMWIHVAPSIHISSTCHTGLEGCLKICNSGEAKISEAKEIVAERLGGLVISIEQGRLWSPTKPSKQLNLLRTKHPTDQAYITIYTVYRPKSWIRNPANQCLWVCKFVVLWFPLWKTKHLWFEFWFELCSLK